MGKNISVVPVASMGEGDEMELMKVTSEFSSNCIPQCGPDCQPACIPA